MAKCGFRVPPCPHSNDLGAYLALSFGKPRVGWFIGVLPFLIRGFEPPSACTQVLRHDFSACPAPGFGAVGCARGSSSQSLGELFGPGPRQSFLGFLVTCAEYEWDRQADFLDLGIWE